jgi:type VI secretion system ImpM family protein
MGLFSRKKKKGFKTGLYGKHPDAADFLRLNASGPDLRVLDEWLSAALVAAERLVPDWQESYLSAPPVSLIFNPGGRSDLCIIATLAPSTDTSGRRFPLVLFAEAAFEVLTDSFPQVPLLSFFESASALHARQKTLGRQQLLEQAERLAPPDPPAFEEAGRRLEDHLDRITVGEAFPVPSGWVQRGLDELGNICRDVAPGRPLPRFGVRVPLNLRPAAQAALWLRLVQGMCPVRLVPNALWTDQRLLLYLDRPSSKALVSLWRGDWEDDTVLDLDAVASEVGPDPARPLRALLSS